MMVNKLERSTEQSKEELSSSQFGFKTLDCLKQSVQEDAAELLSKSVAGGLAGAYLKEGLPLYFISDRLLRTMECSYVEFQEMTGGMLLESIHTDDRKRYLSEIRCAGVDGDYEVKCRISCGDGTFRWMQDIGRHIVTDGGQAAVLFLRIDISSLVVYQNETAERADIFEEKSRELASLAANIPGGVCELVMNDEFTLLYGNDSFFSLNGYTPEQMEAEKENCFLRLIFEEDKQMVREEINNPYGEGKKGFALERRIVCRDGAIIWAMVRGNYSQSKGKVILSCIIIDITDRKTIEQELRINEERFRIALAQTDNTIFDYDLRTKTMIHGDKSAEIYGLMKRMEHVPEALVESEVVHKDSAKAFLEMYEQIGSGVQTASCIIKARLTADKYVWRKISMTAIFNAEGIPVRAVGILEDIDAQRKREEELRYRSERDGMTGLYNKRSAELRVKEKLSRRQGDEIDALFVIDIDIFKDVNDRYGHLFGDFVLTESARRISCLFHKDDIIGRIGGDEFTVFMKKLPDTHAAEKRARQICSAFDEPFTINGVAAKVTCSIGIAFSPRDGMAFEELYQDADISLYEAKRNGKNQYALFHPGLQISSEWVPYSSTEIDKTINFEKI